MFYYEPTADAGRSILQRNNSLQVRFLRLSIKIKMLRPNILITGLISYYGFTAICSKIALRWRRTPCIALPAAVFHKYLYSNFIAFPVCMP